MLCDGSTFDGVFLWYNAGPRPFFAGFAVGVLMGELDIRPIDVRFEGSLC